MWSLGHGGDTSGAGSPIGRPTEVWVRDDGSHNAGGNTDNGNRLDSGVILEEELIIMLMKLVSRRKGTERAKSTLTPS